MVVGVGVGVGSAAAAVAARNKLVLLGPAAGIRGSAVVVVVGGIRRSVAVVHRSVAAAEPVVVDAVVGVVVVGVELPAAEWR